METALVLPDEEREFERIARFQAQVLGQPGSWMQHVFAGCLPALRKQRRGESAHERIGGLLVGVPDGGGQVGENRRCADPFPLSRGERPFDHPVRQHQAPALEDECAVGRLGQAQPAVIEGRGLAEGGRQYRGFLSGSADPLPRAPDQQSVRPRVAFAASSFAGRIDNPAQVADRQEHRPGCPLLREQGEVTRSDPGGRAGPGRHLAPDRDPGIFLLAEQRGRRDLLVSPDPDQHPVIGSESEAPDAAADPGGPGLDHVFEPVEREIALVHPENGRRDGPAVGRDHRARQAVDGNGGFEPFPEVVPGAQPGREAGVRVVREGVQREYRVVGRPEALGEGRPQTAPHRVPDHQRSDQDRDRDGGGGGDQEVFAEEVAKAVPGEPDYPEVSLATGC